ncbi:hypothetical protein L2E82_49108 [Cichorium intybus]|uniref:Uncharacterized protein n=1 Tax=Cichorium intybus TaxID=13427 RepID=A0ACB8Z0N5_CICIN|nr:hypothetical protein L2E82_49108 [Cichorium intybus]
MKILAKPSKAGQGFKKRANSSVTGIFRQGIAPNFSFSVAKTQKIYKNFYFVLVRFFARNLRRIIVDGN